MLYCFMSQLNWCACVCACGFGFDYTFYPIFCLYVSCSGHCVIATFFFFSPFYFSFQFHVDKVILKREKTELLNSLVISSVVQISLIHLCLFNYFDGEVGGHRSFLMLIKGKF